MRDPGSNAATRSKQHSPRPTSPATCAAAANPAAQSTAKHTALLPGELRARSRLLPITGSSALLTVADSAVNMTR